MQHSGIARITTARLFSLRRQEQVCLRRHTEAWRDIHASAMHEACTQWRTCRLPAAFYQKMRGMALHCLLTRPDNGAEEFTVCCHCFGTVSPRIAVSPPIFP